MRPGHREGTESIVLDLGPLDFIDSSGLALLVLSHKRFNLSGGDCCFHLLPARVNGVSRTLAVTGLDRTLPFSEKETPQPSRGLGAGRSLSP